MRTLSACALAIGLSVLPIATRAAPPPPEPASPEPASPEPASPEPASPEPASPEPASPEPASPEPASPEPTSPEPASPEPTSPEPSLIPPPPRPVEVDPGNYRMVLAGDILIGLSGAGMITMAVGLGIRSDAVTQRQALTVSEQPDADAIARQARRIDTGVQLAITGGVTAAVLLGAGISLVAIGYRRERLRRLSLPSASFGPHGADLSWTLRF